LGAETSGANIDFLLSTVYDDCGLMNIGQPAALGMFVGVAYAITKLGSLATDITLHKRLLPPSLL
jgi:MFS-type transporter involved in bile tolerance (Atg22 family)